MGHTQQYSWTTWEVYQTNKKKVPNSEKTTYNYVVTFLNNYENEEKLRGTVVHEFTHLYLYAMVGKHKHDDCFYFTMEYLENWLNQNQGLSPRVDKSHDRDQYEDNHSENVTTDDKENTCPECSYPSLCGHSPQCPRNQNRPRPAEQPTPTQKPNIANDLQKAAELDRLKNLLKKKPKPSNSWNQLSKYKG